MANLPALDDLFEHHRARLQGIHGWDDIARLGRTNIARLRQLFAEDAAAALASEPTPAERLRWSLAAEALRALEERTQDDRPRLVRFRADEFPVGSAVYVYAGDTPRSLVAHWIGGTIVGVRKAFRPEWNDGSPNAGYHWELSVATESPILDDAPIVRCTPSEPRLQHARELERLFELRRTDAAFFRIFVENAQRTWSPLWCLERGMPIATGSIDVPQWFDHCSERG